MTFQLRIGEARTRANVAIVSAFVVPVLSRMTYIDKLVKSKLQAK